MPSGTYVRPWLAPYQIDGIFCPERYGLVEASTKVGKTVGCMAWLTELGFIDGKPGRNYWWVAPVFPQAKIPFRRIKRGLPPGSFVANETELTITLPTGAVLWFKGSDKPDTLYGEDVYGAVIDEASRCREEAWVAVRSTLTATRGPVRIIGNVKGRKNWAYKLARIAEGQMALPPENRTMHYAKITAHDAVKAGILNQNEVADAKEKLPEAVFNELYLGIPSDDGGNPFGLTAIAGCVADDVSGDAPAYWGWDLAKSHDWTVGVALDRDGRVCRFERWQQPWEATIRRIRELTQRTKALVDSTGVGDPVLEALQKNGGSNFEGFKFSPTSKQQLMEGLAVAIQRKHVGFPDGLIRSELEDFEYVYTRTGVRYGAPDGLHDDCVCALALAVQLRATARHGGVLADVDLEVDAPIGEYIGEWPGARRPMREADVDLVEGLDPFKPEQEPGRVDFGVAVLD